jgi:hypothetical protein
MLRFVPRITSPCNIDALLVPATLQKENRKHEVLPGMLTRGLESAWTEGMGQRAAATESTGAGTRLLSFSRCDEIG